MPAKSEFLEVPIRVFLDSTDCRYTNDFLIIVKGTLAQEEAIKEENRTAKVLENVDGKFLKIRCLLENN